VAHGRDTPRDGPGSLWLILLVCVVFFGALAYPVHQRQLGTYWTETDLYRWYAPDADRLLAGRFPHHNTYSPPGYPALLAALFPLTGDHFVTGKWLSLAAAALSGLVAFLLFRRLFGEATALLGVGILLLSGEYTAFAIQATTDVVFLLVCLVAVLVLTDDRMAPGRWAVLLGMLSGVAYLVRYNGAFLVVPCLVAVLTRPVPRRRRAVWAAAYVGGLLLGAAPWLAANWIHRGSPFFSESFHDLGWHLYREIGYRSVADLVSRDPLRFLRRYAASVGAAGARFFGDSLWPLPVGPLAALGVVLALRRPRRPAALLVLALVSHLVLVSLTHWETRYHFFARPS
jgi:4-amino-4-deoxy-L-arabinose transferase-like glycosyltransferase